MIFSKNNNSLKSIIVKNLKNFINFFNSPVKAFFISLFIFIALAIIGKINLFKPSGFHFFNFLADALIHGQFNFRIFPPTLYDLILYENKIYAYWPPFPAVLMMPFVALFGINFSDILFTIIIGSINISLFSILINELNKKKIIFLDHFRTGILVLFFAFGTVHITMILPGRVWFTSLVVGVMCILITFISSLRYEGPKAFLFAGLAISAAFSTRMHLFLAGIWPAWYLISTNWYLPKKKLIKWVFYGLLPIIVSISVLFLYNYFRFGNIFDLGYSYHNMNEFFRGDFQKYGSFHIHYLPINIYYQYFVYPFILSDMSNFFMGGSLFLLSPVFFSVFWSVKNEFKNISNLVLILSIFLINIPILLLMGTGADQFGPRYTLDFIVPLLILTAVGIKYLLKKTLSILVFISIFHYIIGLFLFLKAII